MSTAAVSAGSGSSSPADLPRFVAERTAVIELADGRSITVRPATSRDRRHLIEGFDQTSPASRFARFLQPMPVLSERELEHLLAIDQVDHFAWAAFDEDGAPVGVARYIRLPDEPSHAEAAVTVVDAHQRRGIGSILMQLLAESATANGIEHFVAYVGRNNDKVLDAVGRAGASQIDADEYAMTLAVALPLDDETFSTSSLANTLRAIAAGDQP